MRHPALLLTAIALATTGACDRKRHLLTKNPNPAAIPDAATSTATATPPDAAPEPPPISVPDAAPPATITFDHAPWQPGTSVKIWRSAKLVDSKGGADADDGYALTLAIASVQGNDAVGTAGPDCVVRVGGGTAKVSGACQGNDTDVAYKLDLVGQLLAAPRGTVTVGDRSDAFARPLVALFKLQDAGAVMTARLQSADARGAVYALHMDVEGTMIKHGLRLTASLDGTLEVDAHTTRMVGHLGPARATINGGPMTDYRSKGTVELRFGIEPSTP